jgi:4a-hydroxytetrahydrobiopterin dehydratase
MSTLLDAPRLTQALDSLDGWAGDTSALRRSIVMPSFRGAIDLIDAVADVAEEMDHHPTMEIRHRQVIFTLATHSAGGVTGLDVELAGHIDRLAVEIAGLG